MRIALATVSLLCALLPAAAQTGAAAAQPEPTPAAPAPQAEALDTAGETNVNMPAVTAKADSATPDSSAAPRPRPDGFALRSNSLSRLDFSGTIQLKALYHNMTAERDADKKLSLQLRRFKLELDGGFDANFGFRGELLVDGNGRNFGADNAYLYYVISDLVGFKGGKLKRPFSQEALQSSKSLYTIERGELYQAFLTNTTGYAYFDLGLIAYGGFVEDGRSLTYELGVFNGKQSDSTGYDGQQNENLDKGFKAKDVVMRITLTPVKPLKLEAAVSTKAAEDRTDANEYKIGVNTGYEVGADFNYRHLRLMGEASWGDNQDKQDAKILDGSTLFFAFYVMGVWHEDYTRGRASELVMKLEALDPDFKAGKGEGTPNDGKARYTLGVNYFFTPKVSVMADYGVLQPITKEVGQKKLTQDVDLLWRMSF